MTPEVLSWDDTGNNIFLASGRGSWINNPISALRTIEKDNPELAEKIYVGRLPAGPRGRVSAAPAGQLGGTKGAPDQGAAKGVPAGYLAGLSEGLQAAEGHH